jgi:Mn2+/Fe2+ NRAMP family transporter
MKTLIFIFLCLLTGIAIFAQTTTPDVQTITLATIGEAFKQFISYINWLFVLIFMLSTWLINDTADATNFGLAFNWLNKIPKALRTLIIGFNVLILFAWTFGLHTKIEVFKLVLSLLISMVIYKFGINKIFNWISQRFGLKFE